jgi:hypothetical protein
MVLGLSLSRPASAAPAMQSNTVLSSGKLEKSSLAEGNNRESVCILFIDKCCIFCYNIRIMAPENSEPQYHQERMPLYEDPRLAEEAERATQLHERLHALRLAKQWLDEDPDNPLNQALYSDMEKIVTEFCQSIGLLPYDIPGEEE